VKTVQDLIASIEARYPCVPGLWAPVCQTGDAYVNLGEPRADCTMPSNRIPGTCPDGTGRDLAFDVETALYQALICFENYAADWHERHPEAKPTLYWRYERKMVLQETPGRRKRRCYVRCRLVLSDKPIIYADVGALSAADAMVVA
jgi:hypothetical protein